MLEKKIRFRFKGGRFNIKISGKDVKSALGELYENLVKPSGNSEREMGFAAVNMFLSLFGEEVTEKLLLLCQNHPDKTMKKLKRVIKYGLYPLTARQTRLEDRRGVKKYL